VKSRNVGLAAFLLALRLVRLLRRGVMVLSVLMTHLQQENRPVSTSCAATCVLALARTVAAI